MEACFHKINPACFNSNLLLDNVFSGKMLQYEELDDEFSENRNKRIENFCFVFEFARRFRIQPEWEIRKKLYIKTMYMGTNFPDDIINMIITYLEPSKFFQNSSSDCSDHPGLLRSILIIV